MSEGWERHKGGCKRGGVSSVMECTVLRIFTQILHLNTTHAVSNSIFHFFKLHSTSWGLILHLSSTMFLKNNFSYYIFCRQQ